MNRFFDFVTGLAAVSALAGLLLPFACHAHSYKLDNISVGHMWARPPGQGADGIAVYGPILNRGDVPARLVAASSPIARMVRFRLVDEGETSWPEAIELAPNRPVALAAWREHIWLSGLLQPLEEGDMFDLVLDFGKAGNLPVRVVVENPGEHGAISD